MEGSDEIVEFFFSFKHCDFLFSTVFGVAEREPHNVGDQGIVGSISEVYEEEEEDHCWVYESKTNTEVLIPRGSSLESGEEDNSEEEDYLGFSVKPSEGII